MPPLLQGTSTGQAGPTQIEDSDLWQLVGQLPETGHPKTEHLEAVGPVQISEAIQSPMLLETGWHYETPGQLQEEESAQDVLLAEAQGLGQPLGLEPGAVPTPGPQPEAMPAPGPVLAPGLTPGFPLLPWSPFIAGPGPGPWPALRPGTGPGLGVATEPGTTPRVAPVPGLQPPPRERWPPPRGLSRANTWPFWGSDFLQSAQSQVFRAPPPAREVVSAWPPPLRSQSTQVDMQLLPAVSEAEEDYVSEDVPAPQARAPRAGPPRAGAPKEVPEKAPRKAPRSALQHLRTTTALAAAAASSYAAAATSAARRAEVVAKAVRDAPATKLATIATAVAASGPLGTFADILGAGSSRGASALTEDTEVEDDLSSVYTVASLPPERTLSQVMLAAQKAVTPEDKKTAVRYSMGCIAQMPVRHDSLKEEFAQLSSTLQQRLNYLGRSGLLQALPPCRLPEVPRFVSLPQ